LIPTAIEAFDQAIFEQFCILLGQIPKADTRCRMGLPVKWGGCGIPLASDLALPAYLGSIVHSISLQAEIMGPQIINDEAEGLGIILADLPAFASSTERILEGSSSVLLKKFLTGLNLAEDAINISDLRVASKPQFSLSNCLYVKSRSKLLRTFQCDPLRTAEFTSFTATSDENSICGAFLRTLPSHGFTMNSEYFQSALCHYLGLPVYHLPSNAFKSLKCQLCLKHKNGPSPLDSFGYHATACSMGSGKNARHDAIRDLLYNICVNELGINVGLEWPGIIDGSKERPGDILLRGFSNSGGKDLAVDVSVISIPLSQQTFSTEMIRDSAAKAKSLKYREKLAALNMDFTPFIMDTFGGFHSDALKLIDRLASLWASRHLCEFGVAKDFLVTRLSFCLRKSLASQILDRHPGRQLPPDSFIVSDS